MYVTRAGACRSACERTWTTCTNSRRRCAIAARASWIDQLCSVFTDTARAHIEITILFGCFAQLLAMEQENTRLKQQLKESKASGLQTTAPALVIAHGASTAKK